MPTECDIVTDELAEPVAGDSAAIARHAEHPAGCAACPAPRHEAARLAELLAGAGADHVAAPDLLERVLAAIPAEAEASPAATLPGMAPAPVEAAPAMTAPPAAPAEAAPRMTAPAAALPPAAAPVQA